MTFATTTSDYFMAAVLLTPLVVFAFAVVGEVVSEWLEP